MPAHNMPEEKQILKFIENVPFTDKKKKTWSDQIRETGFTQELADMIHKELTAVPKKSSEKPDLSHFTIEFNGLVNRWRLASQSKNFTKR
jgi:hypothetical protein